MVIKKNRPFVSLKSDVFFFSTAASRSNNIFRPFMVITAYRVHSNDTKRVYLQRSFRTTHRLSMSVRPGRGFDLFGRLSENLRRSNAVYDARGFAFVKLELFITFEYSFFFFLSIWFPRIYYRQNNLCQCLNI